jgi:hypothetical protein
MCRAAEILFTVCVTVSFGCVTFQADSMLAEWFPGPDRVHQAVQFHERKPLSETADEIQPILAAHFKIVDYIICGDVLGPLFDSDNDLHHIIGWQIIFGSGDWVEQHPEQADDIDSYTLAGLESGLRAYAIALIQNPRIQSDLMDKLLGLFNDDQLQSWSDEHPCRPE